MLGRLTASIIHFAVKPILILVLDDDSELNIRDLYPENKLIELKLSAGYYLKKTLHKTPRKISCDADKEHLSTCDSLAEVLFHEKLLAAQ